MSGIRPIDIVLERLLLESGPQRLLHGRGGCYDGFHDISIDWYPPCVVVGLFGTNTHKKIVEEVGRCEKVEGVLVQQRDGRNTTSEVVQGSVPEEYVCIENGLKFQIQPKRNQNVGLFLDMVEVRQWVREHSRDANVLNLFAYTASFSVYAVSGGSTRVVNNDMSRSALNWGKINHQLNMQHRSDVRMVPHNLFKSWWKLRQFGPYDLVIVDPPTRQGRSFNVEKNYAQVIKRISSLLSPHGRAVMCLNSPFHDFEYLSNLMKLRASDMHLEHWLPPAAEFEEVNPNAGLKVGVFRRN